MADARALDLHSDDCPDNPFVGVALEFVSQRPDVDFNAPLPLELFDVPETGSTRKGS